MMIHSIGFSNSSYIDLPIPNADGVCLVEVANIQNLKPIEKTGSWIELEWKLVPHQNIDGYLFTNSYALSIIKKGTKTIGQNGFQIKPSKRTFAQDYRFLPISLQAGTTYTLKIYLPDNTDFLISDLKIYDQKTVDQLTLHSTQKYQLKLLFSAATLLVILFMCLFSIGRYFQSEDAAFLYHAGYLMTLFLLILRFLEFHPMINVCFSYLPNLMSEGKTLLAFLPPLLYWEFYRSFLNLDTKYPLGSKRIKNLTQMVLLAIGLHYLLKFSLTNPNPSIWVHQISLVLMLGFASWIILDIFYKIRTPLYAFLISGIFMLILGGLSTFWEDWFIADTEALYWGGHRTWLQLGILLEIFFFSLGLSYKNQQGQAEKIKAQQSLIDEMEQKHQLEIRLQEVIEVRKKLEGQHKELQQAAYEQHQYAATENPWLLSINELLRKHLDEENFGVEQLSRELGYSRMHLHRKVKNLTSNSTSDYIRQYRLNAAYQLIINTNQHISEIAYEVGFRDPSYFSKVFTKNYGINPSELRQNQVIKP